MEQGQRTGQAGEALLGKEEIKERWGEGFISFFKNLWERISRREMFRSALADWRSERPLALSELVFDGIGLESCLLI